MGIFDAIASGVSTSANAVIAKQNLDFQKGTLAYQKDMQQQAWAREDNAVQRRRADLEAAGFSPTLAAGSGASSSSPIQVPTPQNQFNAESSLANMMNLKLQKANIAQTKAQTDLLKSNADYAKSNTALTDQKLLNEQRDYGILTTTQKNFRSTQNGWIPQALAGGQTLLDLFSKAIYKKADQLQIPAEGNRTPEQKTEVSPEMNNALLDLLPLEWIKILNDEAKAKRLKKAGSYDRAQFTE